MRSAIVFFVSYAHADHRLADTLMQGLTEQLTPSKRYTYTLWCDTGLVLGERWHDEIQAAIPAHEMSLLGARGPHGLAQGPTARRGLIPPA